jgi:hypothetical protein
LYNQLNYSLTLYQESITQNQSKLLENATSVLNNVIKNASLVEQQEIAYKNYFLTITIVEILILVVSGYLVYKYLPHLLLYFWLWMYRRWKVVKK